MNYDEAMKHCIFRYVSGSHAYGTSVPESDMDYRGVFIAPIMKAFEVFQTSFVSHGDVEKHVKNAVEAYRIDEEVARENVFRASDVLHQYDHNDLNMSVGTVSKTGEDEELQELRKFIKLAAGSNPNIMEFLFIEKGITHQTPVWERIKANRNLFISKKAKFTFSGYAVAQLKRIQTHRGYLLNPPLKKPVRADYGLPETTTVPSEIQNAVMSISLNFVTPEARELIKQEKQFRTALNEWKAYDGWKKNRNEARQKLEAKYGYDSKHGMHLVRLVRMCKEILTEGKVIVHRPDAEELLAIRNGQWSYEKLLDYAQNMDKKWTKSTRNHHCRASQIIDAFQTYTWRFVRNITASK
jgi:predicted nucleotidyltransferase